jgi:membrane fusion protein (multidrug efflux system)
MSKQRTAGIAVVVLVLIGAAFTTMHGKSNAAGPSTAPPPTVEVAKVEQRDLPIEREWVGTLDGMVNAAIKAQVTGYLLTQNYAEGSLVRKGQLLFKIDARSFQAAVDQAAGQLAQARAQLAQTQANFIQAQSQLDSTEANQIKAQLDETPRSLSNRL